MIVMDELSSWCLSGLIILGLCFCLGLFIVAVFLWRSIGYFTYKGCVRDGLAACSFLTMIVSLVYVVLDWWRIYYIYENRTDINDSPHQWVILFNNVIYYISTILMYFSLIMRVYVMFRGNNQHALSPKDPELICLSIILFIDIIAITLFVLSIYDTLTKGDILSLGGNIIPLIISAVVVIFNDISINSIILYLILTKLYKMIYQLDRNYVALTQGGNVNNYNKGPGWGDNYNINGIRNDSTHEKSTSKSKMNSSNSKSISALLHVTVNINTNLNININSSPTHSHSNIIANGYGTLADGSGSDGIKDISQSKSHSSLSNELHRNENEQKIILNFMTKLSILTIISVIFAQCFPIAVLITDIDVATHKHLSDTMLYNKLVITCWILRAIEAVINCLVLYFTFIFNEKQYNRYFGLCHECLRSCCQKCIVKRMAREINNQDDDNDDKY